MYDAQLSGDDKGGLTLSLQPYYPARSLTEPRALKERAQSFRSHYPEFPMLNLRATQGGVYGYEARIRTGHITCDQVYANGFLWHHSNRLLQFKNQLFPGSAEQPYLYIGQIANQLFAFLKAAQKFYAEFNYHGLLVGELALSGIRHASCMPIVPNGYHFVGDPVVNVRPALRRALELDTHITSSEIDLENYFISFIEQLYWDLGIEEGDPSTKIKAMLKQNGLLVSEA